MRSRLVKRRLEDVQRQLAQARESLAVLEEQVAVWNDALDDARIRALVSETPLQSKEYEELARHVTAANVEMKRRSSEVRELVRARDELLREWSPKDERA
jgi:chromosome segregation ATPase